MKRERQPMLWRNLRAKQIEAEAAQQADLVKIEAKLTEQIKRTRQELAQAGCDNCDTVTGQFDNSDKRGDASESK